MPNRARRSHKANRGWRTSSRQGGGPFRRLFSTVFLAALLAGALISEAARLDLSYGRPYFMPASKRAQILRLTTTENWAREELAKVRALAQATATLPHCCTPWKVMRAIWLQ